MTLREKQLLKRKVSKEHNSNFRAGYVQVSEDHLHRTGLRGRKQYLVFALILLLLLAAVVNVLVTIAILVVLKIDHQGMQSLEMLPHGELIRFLGDAELEVVSLVQNKISNSGQGIDIGGIENNPLILKINDNKGSTMSVRDSSIDVENVENFVVIDPTSGEFVFTTDFEHFRFPETMRRLDTKRLKSNMIVGKNNDDLRILASGNVANGDVIISGPAGVLFSAANLTLTADRSLVMATNGSLHLDSQGGIAMTSCSHMPLNPSAQISPAAPAETYKLCICDSNGRLFRVTSQSQCGHVASGRHPCV